MKEKFKLKGIGVDLTTIHEKVSIDLAKDIWGGESYSIDYIVTSIKSNNDFILSEFTKYASSVCEVMTIVDQLDGLEDLLLDHFSNVQETYNISNNTVLLDTTGKDLDSLDVVFLMELQEKGILSAEGIGIYCPTAVSQIIELKTKLNTLDIELSKVAINNSPLSFNYSIIKWCNENKVDIVGFNPIGGNLTAPSLIDSFSSNYVLEFSAFHCNYIILSGRELINNPVRLNNNVNYLLSTVEVEVDSPEIYELKRGINKLIKPLEKVIYNSVKLSENLILDYEFFSGKLSSLNSTSYLKKSVTVIPDINQIEHKSEIVVKINDLLPQLETIDSYSFESRYAFIRYRVKLLIERNFPPSEGWKLEMIPLTNNSIVYRLVQRIVKKGWDFWNDSVTEKEHSYLLVVPDKEHTLFMDL